MQSLDTSIRYYQDSRSEHHNLVSFYDSEGLWVFANCYLKLLPLDFGEYLSIWHELDANCFMQRVEDLLLSSLMDVGE